MEKAYKLLAIQEKISNNEAKELIDLGAVIVDGKKLDIARKELNENTKFVVQKFQEAKIIFQDDFIIAVNKPPFIVSENLAKEFKANLINRLDKETSGVLLMSKNEEFIKKAINEFKNLRVQKEYIALVNGVVKEEMEINDPILTIKTKNGAFSKIDKNGKTAVSFVEPLMIVGKKSLVKISIKTGRTHQIRVHLKSAGFGILGDTKYAKIPDKRMFLHSYKTKIFDYEFIALLDKSFCVYGFDVPNKF